MEIRDFLGAEFYYRPWKSRKTEGPFRIIRARYASGLLTLQPRAPGGRVLLAIDSRVYDLLNERRQLTWRNIDASMLSNFLKERKKCGRPS